MEKLRVAAYCRVSTDKDDQANSLASQRKYFLSYINAHDDWILDNIYYDEGISGTQTKKRAGFNAMIDEAMHGRIDLILTKEVCRFARNTVDTLSYTRKLKDCGVGVVFTIDNIDTRDCDGELRLTIMASIAQEESRKTSERVKWGQKRRMEQGIVFGRDLLGYYVKDGKMTINEEEAPVVRAIFHKYTVEGKGTHVIARELAEEGLRPMRVKQWSNTVILRVLRNEKYVGDLCQKKTITPNYLTHDKKYNRGEEEKVYLYDHHQPIISRELWNRTQDELQKKLPSSERLMKHSNRYWCSGKLYCGICGSHYVSKTKSLKNGVKYKAWRCYAAANFGRPKERMGEKVGCENSSMNERALLTCMKFLISHIRINYNSLRDEIVNDIKALHTTAARETDQIRNRIEALCEKKCKTVDLALEGVISRQDLADQTKWYDQQIQELEHTLELAGKNDRVRERQTAEAESYMAALDEIMSFDVDNQELYREILEKMVITKNMVDIYLRYLPFAVRMTIRSSGRNESYITEIVSMELIDIP